MIIEIGFNKYYRFCVLIKIIITMFHFIVTFKSSQSYVRLKLLIVAALLPAATGFCIYQVNSEKKVRHIEIKSESPCEKEYGKYCLNEGECYYLVDEDIVASNCIWLNGGRRCEKYMWWT